MSERYQNGKGPSVQWRRDTILRRVVVGVQYFIESKCREGSVVDLRKFGGSDAGMQPFLDHMKAEDTEAYDRLVFCVFETGKSIDDEHLCKIMYDRGHKAYYDNEAPKGSRNRISREHYSRDERLQAHRTEAWNKYRRLWGGGARKPDTVIRQVIPKPRGKPLVHVDAIMSAIRNPPRLVIHKHTAWERL